ncbi:MAG: hypothetical protein K1X57_10945 [Gemmataceae bacterium]|nr:hypothetical protein [Gemmataceae bacterium]
MRGDASRPIAVALFAALGVVAVVAAFLRGSYLLGSGCGVVYAAIATSLMWMLARARTPAGSISVARVVFILLFALPVGYAMAFPASINPDVQVFIDKQATDRRARAELAAVFASDPAYRDLSVSSVHLKVVNITVHGSLGTRADLQRLRSQIAPPCRAAGVGFLHWDVSLRDTGEQVSGLDRDLFQDAEPGAAAGGGGM